MALAVWLPDAPTRSTRSPVRTQRTRTGTRNARTPTLDTPDNGHPDTDAGHLGTLDTGRADIARADTGHLTPDAWTLTEDADRATKPRQASGHLGRHDEPTACWTPNRVPVGAAHAALRNHDGSAVRPPPARETATHHQATVPSLRRRSAAPRRTALLRRFRVESRARRWGSSVTASPYVGGCCGGKCGCGCASSVVWIELKALS
jgi:hypothetical protein